MVLHSLPPQSAVLPRWYYQSLEAEISQAVAEGLLAVAAVLYWRRRTWS